jgi:hypothetical protein
MSPSWRRRLAIGSIAVGLLGAGFTVGRASSERPQVVQIAPAPSTVTGASAAGL